MNKIRNLLFVALFLCSIVEVLSAQSQYIVHQYQSPSFDTIATNDPQTRNGNSHFSQYQNGRYVTFISEENGIITFALRFGPNDSSVTGDYVLRDVDSTLIGGYFQVYELIIVYDTLSARIFYDVDTTKVIYLSFDTSVVSTEFDSEFQLAQLDTLWGPMSVTFPASMGRINFKRVPLSEKLQTPVINDVNVNWNGKLSLDAILDLRAGQHILMMREYEPSLLDRKFSGVCGIDSAENFGFLDPNDLNIQFSSPGLYYITVLSLSDSTNIYHSNVPIPYLLNVPSLVFTPIEQPTIIGHTATNDSLYIDIEFDSRFIATGTGECKVAVIEDDQLVYSTSDSAATLFDAVTPAFCKIFSVNSIVSDSIARFALGTFDPATNYLISVRCSDVNVLNGKKSSEAIMYPASTSMATMKLLSPNSCEILTGNAMYLTIDGNIHSSLLIILEELTGPATWTPVLSTNYTPASLEWSYVNGNVVITLNGQSNGTYRWKVGSGSFIEFSLNEVSTNSSCGAISIYAHEASPQVVAPGQSIVFNADVLGDTTGSQVVIAEVENLTLSSSTVQYYLTHNSAGSYTLSQSFIDTGLYQVRFKDTVSQTISTTVVFTVREQCVGQNVDFTAGINHIGAFFENPSAWSPIPGNPCNVGSDYFATDMTSLNYCDSAIIAPFTARIVRVVNNCPERCETGLDYICSGHGNYVIGQSITNARKFFLIANINASQVLVNDIVKQGDPIASAGLTGAHFGGVHLGIYSMPNTNWDDTYYKVSCTGDSVVNNAGLVIAQDFITDAICPESEIMLAIDQSLLVSANAGNFSASATIQNWFNGFFGVVEIVIISSSLQKSANSSQVIGSQVLYLEPGDLAQLYFTNTGITANGNQLIAIRYKAAWENDWTMVAAQSDNRRNVQSVNMSVLLQTTQVDNTNTISVSVYPNPVTDLLNISTDLNDYTIQVFDALGRLVVAEQNVSELSTSSLSSGVYFLKVISNDKKQTTLRIVKR